VIDKSSEDIIFITNDFTLGAYDIAALYKQRWEIEVFFKFIKQHLNVSHLVSRNSNGIRVMIYMTLILSILLIAYKKLNRIGSYKIAKLRFSLELDNLMTKEIVILCGGDPARAPHLFNDP
jgi:IS4 transposase